VHRQRPAVDATERLDRVGRVAARQVRTDPADRASEHNSGTLATKARGDPLAPSRTYLKESNQRSGRKVTDGPLELELAAHRRNGSSRAAG
jgi:hypothetical protein